MNKKLLLTALVPLAGFVALAFRASPLPEQQKQEKQPSTIAPFTQPTFAMLSPPDDMSELLRQEDLALSASQAIASNRGDLMLLGAEIVDKCALLYAINTQRSKLTTALAAATDAGSQGSADAVRAQLAAWDRLHERCRGFDAAGFRPMMNLIMTTWKQVCERGDYIAELAKATYPVCDSKGTTAAALEEAIHTALRSPNRISVDLAIGILGRGIPGDYGALQEAATRVYGAAPWAIDTELDRLALCVIYIDACGPRDAEGWNGNKLVEYYAAALKKQDFTEIRSKTAQ